MEGLTPRLVAILMLFIFWYVLNAILGKIRSQGYIQSVQSGRSVLILNVLFTIFIPCSIILLDSSQIINFLKPIILISVMVHMLLRIFLQRFVVKEYIVILFVILIVIYLYVGFNNIFSKFQILFETENIGSVIVLAGALITYVQLMKSTKPNKEFLNNTVWHMIDDIRHQKGIKTDIIVTEKRTPLAFVNRYLPFSRYTGDIEVALEFNDYDYQESNFWYFIDTNFSGASFEKVDKNEIIIHLETTNVKKIQDILDNVQDSIIKSHQSAELPDKPVILCEISKSKRDQWRRYTQNFPPVFIPLMFYWIYKPSKMPNYSLATFLIYFQYRSSYDVNLLQNKNLESSLKVTKVLHEGKNIVNEDLSELLEINTNVDETNITNMYIWFILNYMMLDKNTEVSNLQDIVGGSKIQEVYDNEDITEIDTNIYQFKRPANIVNNIGKDVNMGINSLENLFKVKLEYYIESSKIAEVELGDHEIEIENISEKRILEDHPNIIEMDFTYNNVKLTIVIDLMEGDIFLKTGDKNELEILKNVLELDT